MSPRSKRAVLVVTSLLAMAPCVVHAETEKPVSAPVPEDAALYSCKSRTAEVAINFKPDIELKELMTWVVGFTCKNFILDPRVITTGKKVTVIAPNKMTAHEAYQLFNVALTTMNLTIVPKGNVYRIVDGGAGRRDTVPILRKGLPDGDQVVRYILRPTHAAPDVLVQALTAMKSDIGDVQQIGSLLMITDYGGNVRDMLSLAKIVDVPKGSEGIYTIAIQHATATVVADKVGGIVGVGATNNVSAKAPPAAGAPPTATPSTFAPSKVMVDERTNTIILLASEAAFDRYRVLAKTIDIPLDIEGGASIHHYRLANAIAEELAKTLNDTIGQNQAPPAQPGQPKVTADPTGATVEGKVRVIADKPTNSLIVMSTGRDFLAIKSIIQALDQPRPQVYIEAMIVEVNIGDALNTDGSLHGASPLDKAMLVGGVHTTDAINSTSLKTSALAKGGLLGLVGPSVSVLGLTIPSYGVLFNALADKSKARVLSTPSVMALDNETAKFKSGKTIPYIARTTFTNPAAASSDTPFAGATQSIERADLNLEVEVKPHISSENSVLLEIKHDSKEEGEKNALGPTWNNRSVETRVLVRDQQTIVIGGMMQEKEFTGSTQVPILGDIPILGHLFKSTTKTKRKSNTIILLTPYIIRNHMDLEAIKQRKVREHEEFVGSLQSFEAMKYVPKLDYGKKRGLVEEINRAIEGVEEDAAMINSMKKAPRVPTGPIEMPATE